LMTTNRQLSAPNLGRPAASSDDPETPLVA
jgi:hypothetical protein